MFLQDCPEIADFFTELVDAVGDVSLQLQGDDTVQVVEGMVHPYKGRVLGSAALLSWRAGPPAVASTPLAAWLRAGDPWVAEPRSACVSAARGDSRAIGAALWVQGRREGGLQPVPGGGDQGSGLRLQEAALPRASSPAGSERLCGSQLRGGLWPPAWKVKWESPQLCSLETGKPWQLAFWGHLHSCDSCGFLVAFGKACC